MTKMSRILPQLRDVSPQKYRLNPGIAPLFFPPLRCVSLSPSVLYLVTYTLLRLLWLLLG